MLIMPPYKDKSSARIPVVLFCVLAFVCSCFAAHIIHKHCPTHSADPADYDSSCYWIKTDKANQKTQTCELNKYLISVLVLYLPVFLFRVLRMDCAEIFVNPFTHFAVFGRAPPYRPFI